jgi:hypothetical protein
LEVIVLGTIYIQGQAVNDDGEVYEIYIHKPIYGHCVALNSDIIKLAKLHLRSLLVKCPGASEKIAPDDWVSKSKRIEKVFRRPDQPMILYQGHIGETQPEVRARAKVEQLSLV